MPVDSTIEDVGSQRTFEQTYDEATPASIAIIQAICAIENVDPTEGPAELGFTLFDHVDPDALDTVLADGSGDGETVIELTIDCYHVQVVDTGRIRIDAFG